MTARVAHGEGVVEQPGGQNLMTMSELVERAGVPAATVRYYLAEALLPPPRKVAANRFLYDERHVEIIRLVRLLQARRGLALGAIRALIPDLLPDLVGRPDDGRFRSDMWRRLFEERARSELPADARSRLIEAGISSFSRHGFAEVSIDDVCRAASIAKGSFYRHFASKADLFFVVALEASRRACEFIGSTNEAEPLIERIADATEPYLTIVLDLASLASQRKPGHARVLRSFLGSIRDAVTSSFPELSADELAEITEVGVARAVRRATTDAAPIPSDSGLDVVVTNGPSTGVRAV